ncbi:hypothetical protein F4778DRAFT_777990 [Xylariomycetidae sp. FL2044]|nr:hypothetical protein F4778DRAFT_777990 [Xylariomycetidae sp. FL2044]
MLRPTLPPTWAFLLEVLSRQAMAMAMPSPSFAEDVQEPAPSTPPFVPTSSMETHVDPRTPNEFQYPFTKADNAVNSCQVKSHADLDNKESRLYDCEGALVYLTYKNGYWDCSNWVIEHNLRFFRLFAWGSCHLWVTTSRDESVRIGNGDLMAWISYAVNDYKAGDNTSAQGTSDCGRDKISWEINAD